MLLISCTSWWLFFFEFGGPISKSVSFSSCKSSSVNKSLRCSDGYSIRFSRASHSFSLVFRMFINDFGRFCENVDVDENSPKRNKTYKCTIRKKKPARAVRIRQCRFDRTKANATTHNIYTRVVRRHADRRKTTEWKPTNALFGARACKTLTNRYRSRWNFKQRFR